jgi:hypothetical protein
MAPSLALSHATRFEEKRRVGYGIIGKSPQTETGNGAKVAIMRDVESVVVEIYSAKHFDVAVMFPYCRMVGFFLLLVVDEQTLKVVVLCPISLIECGR